MIPSSLSIPLSLLSLQELKATWVLIQRDWLTPHLLSRSCSRFNCRKYTRAPPVPPTALPYGWRVVSACGVDNAARVLGNGCSAPTTTTRPRPAPRCVRARRTRRAGWTTRIVGRASRMGTSVTAGTGERPGMRRPVRLRMTVRRRTQETRRILMGAVGLGGSKFSRMSRRISLVCSIWALVY